MTDKTSRTGDNDRESHTSSTSRDSSQTATSQPAASPTDHDEQVRRLKMARTEAISAGNQQRADEIDAELRQLGFSSTPNA